MVDIFRSRQLVGNMTCIEDDPDILTLRNCIYNPLPDLGAPGLYDCGRKLILASCYSRGPDPGSVVPNIQLERRWEDVATWAEDERFIFLGLFHHHYGHFLLSTLSRLWAIRDLPSYPILCFSADLAAEFTKPYVRDLLRALGIGADRFVTFAEPTKLGQVVLPCRSFEEQNFAHRTFARMCNRIGDRLVPQAVPEVGNARPLFLSKKGLRSGIRMIVNESDICEHLEKRGVEIALPEQLSFSEQIALWRGSRPVVSFSGSALHTSVFSPSSTLVSIGYDPSLNSSFPLCDWANGSRAAYFHVDASALENLGPQDLSKGEGAHCAMRARDPGAVADAVMRAIDAAGVGGETLSGAALGKNLSRGCSTLQSSFLDDPASGGPSATSGFLSGTHQFHTTYEVAPWWQVDLGSSCSVSSVVIYNRGDVVPERAAHVAIEISSDGVAFETVYEREDNEPFGGLNGQPLTVTFDRAVPARWLRLSVPGPAFFHLDQVEAFGHRR